jgi:hypothetical protein
VTFAPEGVMVSSGAPGGLNGGNHAPKSPLKRVIAATHAPRIRLTYRAAHRILRVRARVTSSGDFMPVNRVLPPGPKAEG